MYVCCTFVVVYIKFCFVFIGHRRRCLDKGWTLQHPYIGTNCWYLFRLILGARMSEFLDIMFGIKFKIVNFDDVNNF